MTSINYTILYILLHESPSLTCTLPRAGDIVQGSHPGRVTSWDATHILGRTGQSWQQDKIMGQMRIAAISIMVNTTVQSRISIIYLGDSSFLHFLPLDFQSPCIHPRCSTCKEGRMSSSGRILQMQFHSSRHQEQESLDTWLKIRNSIYLHFSFLM